MGCAVDDMAALAAQLNAVETVRVSAAVAGHRRRARRTRRRRGQHSRAVNSGPSLLWRVDLEDGGRREGAVSTADCAELWRGEVGKVRGSRGAGSTCPRICRPATTIWRSSWRTSVSRCSLVLAPPQCYEPATIAQGGRLWGVAVQLYTRAVGRELGDRRLRRSRAVDPLVGTARRRLHRPQSAARARPGRPAAIQSLQRIEPAFSQRDVHRGAGGARVRRKRCRARARRRAAVHRALATACGRRSGWIIRASRMPNSRSSGCCSRSSANFT